jgi:hypothetical protein
MIKLYRRLQDNDFDLKNEFHAKKDIKLMSKTEKKTLQKRVRRSVGFIH